MAYILYILLSTNDKEYKPIIEFSNGEIDILSAFADVLFEIGRADLGLSLGYFRSNYSMSFLMKYLDISLLSKIMPVHCGSFVLFGDLLHRCTTFKSGKLSGKSAACFTALECVSLTR